MQYQRYSICSMTDFFFLEKIFVVFSTKVRQYLLLLLLLFWTRHHIHNALFNKLSHTAIHPQDHIRHYYDFEHGFGSGVPRTMACNSLLVNTSLKNRSSLVQKLVLSIRRTLQVRNWYRTDEDKENSCWCSEPERGKIIIKKKERKTMNWTLKYTELVELEA